MLGPLSFFFIFYNKILDHTIFTYPLLSLVICTLAIFNKLRTEIVRLVAHKVILVYTLP
ncbi:hypothetical protein MTMBA_19100 [Moorella thermoacetica]